MFITELKWGTKDKCVIVRNSKGLTNKKDLDDIEYHVQEIIEIMNKGKRRFEA